MMEPNCLNRRDFMRKLEADAMKSTLDSAASPKVEFTHGHLFRLSSDGGGINRQRLAMRIPVFRAEISE